MIVISPLAVYLPRKTMPPRKVLLNLNSWLHWNVHFYNAIKKQYCEDMKSQLEGIVLKNPVQLNFRLYRGNRRVGDRANVLTVHEKLFADALVHYGCLPDDNDMFIHASVYLTGSVDSKNPRVEITILEKDELKTLP